MIYKILIVDDEPSNLRALERLLRSKYQILTAGSGPDALAVLEHHEIALLIADQRMPSMTGIDLMERTVKLRPHMVRILLTGYTDVSSLIDAINSGHVYKYVTKPWNNQDLLVTVGRALQHYEAMKGRHNLQMTNERLRARLSEIAELATIDQDSAEETLRPTAMSEPQMDFVSSN